MVDFSTFLVNSIFASFIPLQTVTMQPELNAIHLRFQMMIDLQENAVNDQVQLGETKTGGGGGGWTQNRQRIKKFEIQQIEPNQREHKSKMPPG